MSWSGELAQVSRSGEGNAAVVLIFSVECVDCVFPLTPPPTHQRGQSAWHEEEAA